MLLKSDDKLWFIHSNHIGLAEPDKEIAAENGIFDASASYYVETFSTEEEYEKMIERNSLLYYKVTLA